MNTNRLLTLTALAALTTGVTATAQLPEYLLTYSQTEGTVSGSGGTVLGMLRPNEICQLRANTVTCPTLSAEKWLPRTAANVMAGDEDADGQYDNASIFGRIDALLANQGAVAGLAGDNQRTVFWSPSQAMGNAISGTQFRPGDVGRIIRNGAGEGQVQYFMRMEMFTSALGMPAGSTLDIDAIAFSPNYGVFFSLDADTLAITDCGPTFVRDGDVLCVPPYGLTYTPDLRIASVVPSSAIVVHPEALMDTFIVNAQVTNRFGGCISFALDVESLEIDFTGPSSVVSSCAGIAVPVPTLLFSTETGTGASVLSTRLGGQIHNIPCGPAGTSCGFGPTLGPQMGVRQTSATVGAPSFVNALSFSRACRSVLEPQQHTLNIWPLPSPPGAFQIDYSSDFAFNIALIEIVAPVIPGSISAFPWSQLCFPDLYAPSINVHAWPLPGPFGSFPMIGIPAGWSGKVLYQNVGFGSTLELSTPCVIDVN
ncbi:MAG: hypothetical protein ACI89X_002586 [Planctomycetota bacterium]|jgi:hypothetical protein